MVSGSHFLQGASERVMGRLKKKNHISIRPFKKPWNPSQSTHVEACCFPKNVHGTFDRTENGRCMYVLVVVVVVFCCFFADSKLQEGKTATDFQQFPQKQNDSLREGRSRCFKRSFSCNQLPVGFFFSFSFFLLLFLRVRVGDAEEHI